MKKCCICKQELSFESFNKSSLTKDSLQTVCRECQKKQYDIYRRTHPEITRKRWKRYYNRHQSRMIKRTRDYEVKIGKEEYVKRYKIYNKNMKFKKYNLSEEKYHKMRKEQKQKCAMCFNPFRESPRSVHIDHNHKTGKVRGILCDGCNLFLGRIESPKYSERLKMARAYLRKTKNIRDKEL